MRFGENARAAGFLRDRGVQFTRPTDQVGKGVGARVVTQVDRAAREGGAGTDGAVESHAFRLEAVEDGGALGVKNAAGNNEGGVAGFTHLDGTAHLDRTGGESGGARSNVEVASDRQRSAGNAEHGLVAIGGARILHAQRGCLDGAGTRNGKFARLPEVTLF